MNNVANIDKGYSGNVIKNLNSSKKPKTEEKDYTSTEQNKKDRNDLTKDAYNVEDEFKKFRKIATKYPVFNIAVNKEGVNSYMNDYAFISYGGSKLNGTDSKNDYWGSDNGHSPTQGLLADYDKWKDPTAKNIIAWSLSLKSKDAVNLDPRDDGGIVEKPLNQVTNGASAKIAAKKLENTVKRINSNLENAAEGVGYMKYEWKDFSFLKDYGSIPNNRLLTLRRFKLPVMDNGVVAAKNRFIKALGKGAGYIESDSARALTYFGEETGNDLSKILDFSVSLNWTTLNSVDVQDIRGGNNNGNYKGPTEIEALDVLKTGAGGVGGQSLDSIKPESGNKRTAGGTLSAAINYSGLLARNKQLQEKGLIGSDRFLDQFEQHMALSPDANPYFNSWKHRVYGPINVITKTYKRNRGLDYTGSINLNFSFDTMQIDSINPKIAMLDILANMLSLTYNNGNFWGGEYRFFTNLANAPVNSQLSDFLLDIGAGNTNGQTLTNLATGVKNTVADYKNSFIENLTNSDKSKNTLKSELESLLPDNATNKEINAKFSDFTTALAKYYSDMKAGTNKDKNGNVTSDDETNDVINKLKDLTATLTADSAGGSPLSRISAIMEKEENRSKFGNLKSALGMIVFGQGTDINNIKNQIINLEPLITGEPVGEWHLTVGNPMNPIAMIGNLVCLKATFSFGKALGPDDFPTQLNVSISLEHGRPRDKGDIESIFNMGQGRLYSVINKNNQASEEPWNTGASSKNTENDNGNAFSLAIDNMENENNLVNTASSVIETTKEDFKVDTKSPF